MFHDRLINDEDKSYFYYLMKEICTRNFGNPVLILPDEAVIKNPPVLLFGDFMTVGAAKEDRIYEEIRDVEKLRNVLLVRATNREASNSQSHFTIYSGLLG